MLLHLVIRSQHLERPDICVGCLGEWIEVLRKLSRDGAHSLVGIAKPSSIEQVCARVGVSCSISSSSRSSRSDSSISSCSSSSCVVTAELHCIVLMSRCSTRGICCRRCRICRSCCRRSDSRSSSIGRLRRRRRGRDANCRSVSSCSHPLHQLRWEPIYVSECDGVDSILGYESHLRSIDGSLLQIDALHALLILHEFQ